MPFWNRRWRGECQRIRDAAMQSIGLSHFPSQIRGGWTMFQGRIAEMGTGEGKTLTATVPAALHALAGRPVMIATANDYLAHRDSELMRPVFEALGLSVGCIQSGQPRDDRGRAYGCDITYGTAKEFGFDCLRDHLETRRRSGPRGLLTATGPARVQREPGFLLLDEIDSLLIDEARTPLILSGPTGAADAAHAAAYGWAARFAGDLLLARDYIFDRNSGWPALTPEGRARVRRQEMPAAMTPLNLTEVHHFLERALHVQSRFQRDRHYVVRDGKVQIVDEFTGRIQPGRSWNDGIHQAVEAREGLTLTVETGRLARITLQEYVRDFPFVAGMTGTAREAAREFRSVYGLPVRAIPPHRPLRRRRLPDEVFRTHEEKWEAIVRETLTVLQAGRAVLVGAPTIAASQSISTALEQAGIPHRVLNALNPEAEAEVVAQAGQPQCVTVATNMAGRGTDIRLADSVRDAGGLHVVGTELHAAARIDRQLEGRCGRQGDPGTFRQYLALDDEILHVAYGTERAERWRRGGFDPHRAAALLRRAQRSVEQEHFLQRADLLQFDRDLNRATRALGLDPVLDAIE